MFSTAKRLLIRWDRGMISIGDSGKEQYLEIAGIKDYEQAKKIGEDLLDAYKGQRGTLGVTGHVFNGSQQPGSGFYVLDKMAGQQVQSINVGMDEEGQTVVTPELGDPLAMRLEQMNRRIAKASAGVTSEWAAPGAPPVKEGEKSDTTQPDFSWKWTTAKDLVGET